MYKISRTSKVLHLVVVAGIDPDSDGLAHARKAGVETTSEGLEGLLRLPASDEVAVVFDATSAQAHSAHNAELRGTGRVVVDLTPAALGPFVVPPVNLDRHIDRPNVNMVTCGGQATIPIVAAISAITQVHYAEIVAAIASRSAGAGTRANIDEFTETTRRAIVEVGGAKRAKAIIILNPAEPPMVMRDTVMCLVGEVDESAVNASVHRMVEQVGEYVPGYRLKQEVQFERVDRRRWIDRLIPDPPCRLTKVTVFLEIEGAGHYLPSYAGNLDIMTSAALRTGELIAATRFARLGP